MNDPSAVSRLLGRYELVQLLGQGGMGEVYLAKISGAAGFEKPCIVKTVLPALLKDGQFLDRFHHEAKVLVHLVHSSIAQVYDMGEADGVYYMALEYVAGVDLAYLTEQARAQGQQLPVPVALYLGQRIAEGLGYAHRKTGPDGQPLGIVHRDVSPHNVMVSYEGEVKVIDFGLAKSAARSKYTLPSTVMGKLGYMSPEQVRAEPVDHRSDIFSAGVVVWELLAGRPLVGNGTMGEMMAAMANPSVPALHELRPDVDPALDAVIRRALAPTVGERYARADEFARALNEHFLRTSGTLGAEEVGNFVRAVCPDAFASQRKLLSRLSSSSNLRRTPLPLTPGGMPNTGIYSSPAPLQLTEPAGGVGFADTMVRGGGMAPAPAALSPVPVASLAASPASGTVPVVAGGPSRKVWGAVIALGALGLIGASAGVTAVMLNRSDEPPAHPAPIVRPGPPGPGYGGFPPPPRGPPPHHPGEPPPPPPHMGRPERPPPPSEYAAEGGSAHLPPPEPRPEPLGEDEPVRPGPGRNRGDRFVPVQSTATLRSGPGGLYSIAKGSDSGVSLRMVLPVVEGPVSDGKAKLLGHAVVKAVSPDSVSLVVPRRVRHMLDANTLVVLPAVAAAPVREAPVSEPAPEPGPAVPAPPRSVEPPAASRTLNGRVRLNKQFGQLFKTIELTNTDTLIWTDCTLVTDKRWSYKLEGGIAPEGKRSIPMTKFAKGLGQGRAVERNRLGLFCAEGEFVFPFRDD